MTCAAESEFSIDKILQTAHQLKYTSAIKKEIVAQMEAPSGDFVRLVTANLQLGRFTSAIREQFTPMVKTAFREIIRDLVQARLSTALADTEAADVAAEPPPVEADEVIATTEEKREGFMIVRAIVRDILKPARIVMRDQKSYCGILVDDNNRRPPARLHFNRSVKYIGFFDSQKEEWVKIDTLDEIYEHAERLRAMAQVYSAP